MSFTTSKDTTTFDPFTYTPMVTNAGSASGLSIPTGTNYSLMSITGVGILQDLRVACSANLDIRIKVDGVMTSVGTSGAFVTTLGLTNVQSNTNYYYDVHITTAKIPFKSSLEILLNNTSGSTQSSITVQACAVYLLK